MRNYEGTLRLQGLGVLEGIKAKNIKVGDVLVWNYGGTELVKEITFSKTGKTLVAVVECNGKDYERKMNAERIVVVEELNPVEEIKEIIAQGLEIQANVKNMEIQESIKIIDQYLEMVAKIVNSIENDALRHELRDIENPLKWTLCNLEELAEQQVDEETLAFLEPQENIRIYGTLTSVECIKESKHFVKGKVYRGMIHALKGHLRLIGDNGKYYIVKEERFKNIQK